MLYQMSEDEKRSLGNVAVTNDGQKFITILMRELAARDKENRVTEGDFAYRGQGRALQLQELIDLLDKADPKGY